MSNKYLGQVVWITGASSGIGAALAKEFIRQGAIVALSARRIERLKKLSYELGPNAHIFPLDVQDKLKVNEICLNIVDKLDKIDVVVANAGYSVFAPMLDITEEMWRRQFEVNFFGVVWTTLAAIPYLKKTQGRIAIMSSVAGKLAFSNLAAYSASKFALMGLANALYLELREQGVSVTAIAPGLVESEINQIDNLGRLSKKDRFSGQGRFLKWPTEKAARAMTKAIYDRKREQVITGHGKIAAFFATHFPAVTYWGMAKIFAKIDSK
jgi:short-subunit dehydrogenase